MPGAFTRTGFHKLFKSAGPAVTPVIHAQDETQVCRNIDVALRAGAAGVFLINHDFPPDELLPIVRAVRTRYPYLWLGLNFLAVTGLDAFPVLAKLAGEDVIVDAYWADDARVDERVDEQTEANAIARLHAGGGWHGLYFGGVAFKKQRPVEPALYTHSAGLGAELMDVVTTSGIATGEAIEEDKITAFRAGLGNAPLAIASGVTPDNAHLYAADVDCFLVATGINIPGDFYNIDPARLDALLAVTRDFGTSDETS